VVPPGGRDVVNVVWVSYHRATVRARGYADQGLVEWLLADVTPDAVHTTSLGQIPNGQGAIVVVPARHHAADVDRLNADLARLPWTLVMLTGDEGAEFPWRDLRHPHLRLWIQTPDPTVHAGAGRFIGDGPSAWLPSLEAAPVPDKTTSWFFAGQVTHDSRKRCASVLKRRRRWQHDGDLVATEGFMQGLPPASYLAKMLQAKVAPAPSGPVTPDTFRLYEALEAGCVPIAEGLDYWRFLFGDVPFPVLTSWAYLGDAIDDALATWPTSANRCSAWWQGVLRGLRYGLIDDLHGLGVQVPSQPITVLVSTSPIRCHPSTEIIKATVDSVQAQLPNADVLVLIDGVHGEQEHLRSDYAEYVRRLLWLCRHHWTRTTPVLFDNHRHQAAMTREALDMVRTPLVLFVEHDAPIHGEIPWDRLAAVIRAGRANLVRLHHESSILPDHQHLMLDSQPQGDPPLIRTVQWSQRPHLASTDFYRWLIHSHFAPEARTMIEDVVYGALEHARNDPAVWERYRTWIYAPAGDMKRSWHLDGRGDDPKLPMHFAYPDEPPPGAPWPQVEASV
jgi:hypothetical protein